MKRNHSIRIAIVLLAVVLVSTLGMAGTLSRYVSDIGSAAATVRAGIWDVADLGNDIEATAVFVLAGSGAVVARDGDDIIVPGSTVTFTPGDLLITNNSEVAADIILTGATLAVPAGFAARLTFTYGGTTYTSLDELNTALASAADTPLATILAGGNTTLNASNLSIAVNWPFNAGGADGNALDTAIGAAAEPDEIVLNFTLRAQQAAATA